MLHLEAPPSVWIPERKWLAVDPQVAHNGLVAGARKNYLELGMVASAYNLRTLGF